MFIVSNLDCTVGLINNLSVLLNVEDPPGTEGLTDDHGENLPKFKPPGVTPYNMTQKNGQLLCPGGIYVYSTILYFEFDYQ
jgi:hypothetical protein